MKSFGARTLLLPLLVQIVPPLEARAYSHYAIRANGMCHFKAATVVWGASRQATESSSRGSSAMGQEHGTTNYSLDIGKLYRV